jgi:hypothetical protein
VFAEVPEKWGGYLSCKLKHPGRSVGIEGMTFHTLRHWFTTNLVRRGIPLGDVAKLTGHETLRVLLRYGGHSPRDSSRTAIAALDDAALARERGDGYEARGPDATIVDPLDPGHGIGYGGALVRGPEASPLGRTRSGSGDRIGHPAPAAVGQG